MNKIGHITLLVKDQDEALKFYTEKLGFQKRQDLALGNNAVGYCFAQRPN